MSWRMACDARVPRRSNQLACDSRAVVQLNHTDEGATTPVSYPQDGQMGHG